MEATVYGLAAFYPYVLLPSWNPKDKNKTEKQAKKNAKDSSDKM